MVVNGAHDGTVISFHGNYVVSRYGMVILIRFSPFTVARDTYHQERKLELLPLKF